MTARVLVSAIVWLTLATPTAIADESEYVTTWPRDVENPPPPEFVLPTPPEPFASEGDVSTGVGDGNAKAPGGSFFSSWNGGGPGSRADLDIVKVEEYPHGHWRGIAWWYRVTNDASPTQRFYMTVTAFEGKGFSCDRPYHDVSDVYHLARGWAADGNTFLSDFEPRDEGTGSSTYSFSVSTEVGVGYSWTQTKPAEFRYSLTDFSTNGWDDHRYDNHAGFGAWGGDRRFTGQLEYAAAGVVPAGHVGYMYIRMIHTSSCNNWTWHTDDIGWKAKTMDWA